MVELKIKEIFNGLDNISTREKGLILRKNLEQLLKTEKTVVLDFEGINLITQSFADEVIGVLIRKKGLNFVKSHVKIKNASDFIKSVFKFVISYSKKAA